MNPEQSNAIERYYDQPCQREWEWLK